MLNREPISGTVSNEIKKHFKFLFDRGYEIDYAEIINTHYDVWEVVLKHNEYRVRVFEERGGLDLFFGSSMNGFIEIRSLIFFLSGEKDLIYAPLAGMKKYARLLQEHIDEFELCFGSEYSKFEEGLKYAEKKFDERLMSPLLKLESISKGIPLFSSIAGIFLLSLLVYILIIDTILPSSNNVGVISIVLAALTTLFLKKRTNNKKRAKK
jgi:hypothetical protein